MILEICSLTLSFVATCMLIRNQIKINQLEAKWRKDYKEIQTMIDNLLK